MKLPEPILIESASILLKLNKLCPDADTSNEAQIAALGAIHRLLTQGWTSDDIVAYLKWSEDFNPTVSETVALRMMALVSAKYPRLMATMGE